MDTLRNYTFLPWSRLGIASEIAADDNLGNGGAAPERAAVAVSFKVNGEPVAKQAEVLGPGDVIGISPRAVVKTDPRNWVTDFEANYLPYIEFYEEDFPWRFTPARAVNPLERSRLRPWIFLLVLEEGEFLDEQTSGPLPAISIGAEVDLTKVLPPVDQSWAWAHVHVSRNIIGDALRTASEQEVRSVEQQLEAQLRSNPDIASSRLLCPRKLKKSTAYHAFVIPAFEAGRLAGLGQEVSAETNGQLPSWGNGQRLYPFYYRWFYRTGASGDFEFLVDQLEPRPVDRRVGIRDMDVQDPGYEVGGITDEEHRVMGLEGALKSPETTSAPSQWPPAETDFESPAPGSVGSFLNQLEQTVNLQFDLQQEEDAEHPHHPDPIVSPPLYGRWYALAERLDVRSGAGWVDELNRDPRLRTPAGAGTEVIQNEQEKFMQQAWAQLGGLLEANQKIRQLQLAVTTTFVAYQKNLLPQAADQLMQFTQAMHSRVLGSPTTIAQQVRGSRLPNAAVDPAFRKLARPRGAVMRRVVPAGTPAPRDVVARLNDGRLTAAPPAPEPTGQISLDETAGSIEPRLPGWLEELLRDPRFNLVFGLVALVILVVLFAVGGLVLAIIGLTALGALALAIRRLRRALAVAEAFQEASFTPASVDRIPPRPNFVQTEFDEPLPASPPAASGDSAEAANFRVALRDAFNVYQSPPPAPPVAQPLDLSGTVQRLRETLDPVVAIPRRAEFILKIPASFHASYLRPHRTFVTVMAHPVFAEPMYRPLRDLSPEFIAPNLGLIPNNTISLMETNQRFIEAYMVGLNEEMGRELLWRQFPTDQRGSYFRQFWDVSDTVNRDPDRSPAEVEEELLDITKLHTWERDSELGSHAARPLPTGAEPGDSRLVLVVRGDVLKKYPTAVIYAQRARWTTDEQGRDLRELDDTNPAENLKEPLFKAEIDPDLRFLGFDLTAPVVKGDPDPAADDPGWYFVIQERPGEPRFGLDDLSEESPATAGTWNELAWEHLGNFAALGCVDLTAEVQASTSMPSPDGQFQWGQSAADMAYILYQVPVMVAFHAADMLE